MQRMLNKPLPFVSKQNTLKDLCIRCLLRHNVTNTANIPAELQEEIKTFDAKDMKARVIILEDMLGCIQDVVNQERVHVTPDMLHKLMGILPYRYCRGDSVATL
jgi:hypothetical protein